jgi:glycine oxidase
LLWPEWLAELPAPVFYRDHGTLLLWHPEDAGEAGRAFKMIASCRSHPGIKRLGHSRIGHLEPALGARISEALYIPGEAQLDNRAFLRAVAIAVEEAGVECHWETFVEEDTVPDAGRLTLW